MINLWLPIFASRGYTLAELRYATGAIAGNPPKYRSEHLDQIHVTIGALRKKSMDEESSAFDEIDGFEACKDCRGVGWVSVPHQRFVVNEEWVTFPGTAYKPLVNVTCSCNVGTRVSSAHTRHRPMGLEQYEQRNPDWRRQMAESEIARKAQKHVAQYAAEIDQRLGQLVASIAANMDAKSQTCPDSSERSQSEQDDLAAAAKQSQQRSANQQLRLFDEDPAPSGRDDRVTEGLKL